MNTLQSPEAPAETSAPTASPVGYPQPWVVSLFPHLDDLSQNPVYIRLAGQGYGRRIFWRSFSGPAEFRALSLDWLILTRPGLGPLLVPLALFLLMIPIAAIDVGLGQAHLRVAGRIGAPFMLILLWAFLFVLTRIIMGRPRHAVVNFFRRARIEGWGQDLWLAGFTPRQINSALFAALLPKVVTRILLMGALLATPLLLGFLTALFVLGDSSAAGMFFLTGYYWILTWIFFSGLEMFDVSRALLECNFMDDPETTDLPRLRRGFSDNAAALLMQLALPFAIALTGIFFFTPSVHVTGPVYRVFMISVFGLVAVLLSLVFIRRRINRDLFPPTEAQRGSNSIA